MPGATHAVAAMFDTDLDREAEQLIGLERFIVPGVRSSAGFVSGHWALDRTTRVSVAFITFDSEEAARKLSDNVQANAEAQQGVGLPLASIRVVEIQAST